MYRLYEDELREIEPDITDKDIELKRDANFSQWLKDKVSLVKLFFIRKELN
jgi:hypothetical protein